ncbi:MAG: heterodisulfide reductase subunit B, partial [Deltaproteobacteria bacterium CG12_big_fil_rev_8_21_14_0_65_43_10]
MKLSYYPGCSLHGTAKEYDESTRAVCYQLGIELIELEDWNCCGASSAHSTDEFLSNALPERNLKIAAKT